MNIKEEKWDVEIRPKVKFLDLNFREVWRYRDLLLLFVRRDFIAQYKQTILGPVWYLIQPVLTSAIYLLIFSRVARVPTEGVPPVLFYLSGITLWNYFSTCLLSTSSAFIVNAAIFGKVYFPRIITPLSLALSNLIKFGFQFLLLIVVMAYYNLQGYHFPFSFGLLAIVPIVLLLAMMSLGLGTIVSSLTTKYRDLSVLLNFIIQLGMYATPIVYSASLVRQSKFGFWIDFNPLTSVVESFRYFLLGIGSFEPSTIAYSFGFSLVVLLIGLALFNRVEKTFMDTV